MIPASSSRTLTISIPRFALSHVLTGLALAGLSVAALALHISLEPGSPYRSALLAGAGLAGAGAGTYWLWCSLRTIRTDQDATLAALASARERDAIAAAQASAILAAVEQLHLDHKEATDQLGELLGAIEALQDCYLNEGRPRPS